MIQSLDAWAFRRLLTDRPLNGEVETVSDALRPLVERMKNLPADDRQQEWDAFLGSRHDRAEIVNQMAEVDPDGPAPEVGDGPALDEGEAEGWGPIQLGSLPPVEAFPLGVLPYPARGLAEAAARSISCAVDLAAVGTLAAASALIGRSVVLRVKPGYHQSASLYCSLVGGASSGKSPSLRAALNPVWRLAEALHLEWRSKMDAWEAMASGERGVAPTMQRIVSTDPTTEALGPILAANPRGLVVAPDEMTKWVMSMDQYKGGRGGDRPFYLSAWNGETIFIDRAKHMAGPIAVPRPFLTVAGGMTPDMLSTLPETGGRDDGFMARLLFAFPDPVVRTYCEEGIPESVASAWYSLALRLWERPMKQGEGRPNSHVVGFTTEANREWVEWCNAHYAEQDADDFLDSLDGAWGKFDAYAARLALITHLMGVASDLDRPLDDIPSVPKSIVLDAVRLVTYFKSQTRRIHALMGGRSDDGGEDVRALLRWIIRNGHDTFSERDIGRNFDRFRDHPDSLSAALAWMASHALIRLRTPPDSSGRGGRKPSLVYDVHPLVKTSPRFRRFRRNAG